MAEQQKRRGGKKGRKYGRWQRKPHNLAYKSQNKQDKNKARRIMKMMRRFPNYRAPGWKLNRDGNVERDN